LLASAFFALYTMLSVRNHRRLRTTGYDLGIFEQAVRAYAEGRAPVSDLKAPGFMLLGDHFHPILMTLAPVYRLFPGPITLLVAQAALLAVSVVPVARLAMQRFGGPTALAIGVAYGLSWGLQTTVDFDFHEVVFAVPLLAFSIEKLLRQRWVAAAAWAVPLVLVKEDLPLTLAAIGGYLILRGQRRLGTWLLCGGIAGFVLILKVLIPAFHPAGVYGFAGDLGSDMTLWEVLLDAPNRLVNPDTKLMTLAAVLAPTAFLAMFSPVTLIAVPTLLWRFMSTNPSHWVAGFHYNAVLMPIVYLALIDALTKGRAILPQRSFTRTRRIVIGVCALTAVVGITSAPLSKLTKTVTWQENPRAAAAHRLMDMIPSGATVAASNSLAPQLTNRSTVRLFPAMQGRRTDSDWVLADTHFVNWPVSARQQADELDRLAVSDYRVFAEEDGFILLRKRI
jgi:uncharacterized membrane protein